MKLRTEPSHSGRKPKARASVRRCSAENPLVWFEDTKPRSTHCLKRKKMCKRRLGVCPTLQHARERRAASVHAAPSARRMSSVCYCSLPPRMAVCVSCSRRRMPQLPNREVSTKQYELYQRNCAHLNRLHAPCRATLYCAITNISKVSSKVSSGSRPLHSCSYVLSPFERR